MSICDFPSIVLTLRVRIKEKCWCMSQKMLKIIYYWLLMLLSMRRLCTPCVGFLINLEVLLLKIDNCALFQHASRNNSCNGELLVADHRFYPWHIISNLMKNKRAWDLINLVELLVAPYKKENLLSVSTKNESNRSWGMVIFKENWQNSRVSFILKNHW